MPKSEKLDLKSSLLALITALALGGFSAAPGTAAAPDWLTVPLDEDTFDLSAASSFHIKNLEGRDALCLNGEAFARGLTLENGSIAVDIANDDRRRFANVIFRASARHTYETAYLRMHKSGQFDAVQYTPHLNGETNWQLFREAQSRADFGNDPWITLRVDFAGDRAKVSLGGDDAGPVLTTELTLPAESGAIGLRTLFEGCFSNFRYSRTLPIFEDDDGRAPRPIVQPALGHINEWSLSNPFPLESWPGIAANPPQNPQWSIANVERNGRLLISRYVQKQSSGSFERNRLDAVYAGVAIHSDDAQVAELQIDASDMATVWLNGSVLYSFDNSFRAKGPLFRGDFDATKQSLNLRLNEGRNELIVLVAERANGWGLAGRVSAEQPLKIEAID
ncbi:hypothetical protein [Erythrobacter sp. F6033]|uniref:hypothetical protein n=1 Tax=Erythrobacter sp. F6033 TaxID=2926401 RepID=UPI001FF48558|nr:hypothetical protein [Erythrobacter sp. F6033]MCK0127602.1 hypothetical protein [Erythrobacter sp. F6033]